MINPVQATPVRAHGRAQRGRLTANWLLKLLVLGWFWFWPLVRADGQSFGINHIDDRSVSVNTTIAIQVSVTDSNIPPSQLNFTVTSNRPKTDADNARISLNYGGFAWTPTQAQVVTFTVTAISFATLYQASTNFTVNVTNAVPPAGGVVIDTIPPQSVAEGTLLTFTSTAHATDNPNSPLVFSLLNPPDGASIVNDGLTSGVFTWTPTAAQAATPFYTIREVVTELSTSATNYQDFQVTVTLTNDCSQYDQFLAAVAQGGYFLLTNCSTIVLTNTLTISKSLILDGGSSGVTISGNNAARLFTVMPRANLTLYGLTLQGGSNTSGGAIYISPGAGALMTNCVLVGNGAVGTNGTAGTAGSGGGNVGKNGGNGTAGIPALGGAIYNLGSLTNVGCQFLTNSATSGSGGSGGGGGDGSFQGGNGGNGGAGALGYGGAIYNLGALWLTNCTFAGNTATGGSGGIGGTNGGGVFNGNAGSGGTGASGSGAAVYSGQSVVAVNCTFSANAAQSGNNANGGTASSGNGVNGSRGPDSLGGGIYVQGNGAVTNCTFANNTVTGGNGGNGGDAAGAGIHIAGNGGNGGNGMGGGLYNTGAVVVVNCTFSSCGAIGGTNGLAGNGPSGSDGGPGHGRGGDIANGSGTFSLRNSILGASSAGTNAYDTSASRITDGGYNISSDASLNLSGTSRKNTDPLLGSLADNSGPTQTMAIQSNSPAINKIPAASSPATDQRGIPRPQPQRGLSDIGAYELVTVPAILIQPQSQTIAQGSNATFAVSAFGDSLTYQWRFNGTNISGATLSAYTLSGGQATNTGNYDVILANNYGSVTSLTALLAVYPFTISGQVFDLTGTNGLPGVLIQAFTNLVVAASTSTDTNGNYILSGLSSNTYTVTPSLPCLVFGPSNIVARVGPTNAFGLNFFATNDFHIIGGTILNGPAGVIVTVSGSNGTEVVTSGPGGYGVSNLCPGFYFVVPALAGYQFQPPTNSIVVPPDTNTVDFTAVQVFSLGGQITLGTNGLPAGGITVAVSGPIATNVTTAVNGTYLVSGLQAGTYLVTPSSPACYHLNLPARSVTLGPTDAPGTDFVAMRDAYTISGRLTNGAAGVSGITVSAGGSNVAVTDATGSYVLSNLCAGAYTITPSASCYLISPASAPTVVGPGDVVGLSFSATRDSHIVGGFITNGPVGIIVTVSGSNGVSVIASGPGSYSISNLCRGFYSVVPSLPGYQFQPPTNSVLVPPDANTVNFTAVQVFSLSGQITQGTNGKGLSGITVAVSGPIATNVTTAADGTYSVGELQAGNYTLTPTAPSCYHFNVTNRSVTLGPTNASGIYFAALQDAYNVSGSITDGGVGVSNVIVQAGSHTTTTDSKGGYVLSGLCGGSYSVIPSQMCRIFNPASIPVTLGPDTTGVNFLTFSNDLSRIRGQITDGVNGLSNVLVTITGGGTAITDANGNYSFSNLCPGTYEVSPSHSGFCLNPQSLMITLGSAQTANGVNFVATPAPYRISGTLAGMPPGPRVSVSIVGATGTNFLTTSTGAYSISNLCPGTYVVTPSNACFQFYPQSWTTTVGPSDDSLDFAVSGGSAFSIAGQVTYNGFGLSNVTVTAAGQTNVTDVNGNYTLPYLCAGLLYPVTASAPNYLFNPATNYVTLSTGDSNGVNFAASSSVSLSGRVVQGASGLPGVMVSVGANTTFTGADGYYTNLNLPESTSVLVVVPSLAGYGFAPAAQSLVLSSNTTLPDFMAFPSLALAQAANGAFQLTFAPAFTCQIQASTDLSHWQPVFSTNNLSTNTLLLQFTDTSAANLTTRFYRVGQTFAGSPALTNWNVTNHSVSLGCVAAPVLACQVDASTNLISWVTIFSSNLPATAPFQFRYAETTNSPVRFYRLSQTPGF
jgi:hypothetical protein